jgi:hypothetical protein
VAHGGEQALPKRSGIATRGAAWSPLACGVRCSPISRPGRARTGVAAVGRRRDAPLYFAATECLCSAPHNGARCWSPMVTTCSHAPAVRWHPRARPYEWVLLALSRVPRVRVARKRHDGEKSYAHERDGAAGPLIASVTTRGRPRGSRAGRQSGPCSLFESRAPPHAGTSACKTPRRYWSGARPSCSTSENRWMTRAPWALARFDEMMRTLASRSADVTASS